MRENVLTNPRGFPLSLRLGSCPIRRTRNTTPRMNKITRRSEPGERPAPPPRNPSYTCNLSLVGQFCDPDISNCVPSIVAGKFTFDGVWIPSPCTASATVQRLPDISNNFRPNGLFFSHTSAFTL